MLQLSQYKAVRKFNSENKLKSNICMKYNFLSLIVVESYVDGGLLMCSLLDRLDPEVSSIQGTNAMPSFDFPKQPRFRVPCSRPKLKWHSSVSLFSSRRK